MMNLMKVAGSVILLCLAAAQSAAINMDATFDPGALPSDFGYPGAGNIDPIPNVADGVWTNNLTDGQSSVWYGGAAAPATIVGPVYHGWSEIKVIDFGTSTNDDKTVMGMARDPDQVGDGNQYGFLSYFLDGNFGVFGTIGGTTLLITVPVANTDGAFHKYGWQMDESTRTLKLYFDDVQIGEAAGYMFTGNIFAENLSYFGDGSGGGVHHEVWDRVVVMEGDYPAIVNIPGDVNNDGFVDIFDVNVVSANWGSPGGPTGDANGDGNVDIFDVNLISANWSPPPAPVPEPGSATLVGCALLGIAGALALRKRKMVERV